MVIVCALTRDTSSIRTVGRFGRRRSSFTSVGSALPLSAGSTGEHGNAELVKRTATSITTTSLLLHIVCWTPRPSRCPLDERTTSKLRLRSADLAASGVQTRGAALARASHDYISARHGKPGIFGHSGTLALRADGNESHERPPALRERNRGKRPHGPPNVCPISCERPHARSGIAARRLPRLGTKVSGKRPATAVTRMYS